MASAMENENAMEEDIDDARDRADARDRVEGGKRKQSGKALRNKKKKVVQKQKKMELSRFEDGKINVTTVPFSFFGNELKVADWVADVKLFGKK